MTTDPLSCTTIWIAVDDASLENGCLWGIPGSHREDPKEYMKLKTDAKTGRVYTIYESTHEKLFDYNLEGAIPFEVKSGTIIAFHGNFLHWSYTNTSQRTRNSYILHMIEGNGAKLG